MKKPIPFGNYLLLERIAIGGMAEVFKAKAFGVEGFERLVAVKRILPNISEDEEFITMFIDEAKLAVQLTHANIGQIFDLGRVEDSYFIAMEFVEGKDLRVLFHRARQRGERLPVPLVCYVIMKACEGLDYAHNKKDQLGHDLHLVHRDVSPQNMLISYDGEVKLIDFGIAKAASRVGQTQAGILKGKFGYMSPEQVRGLPLDRRTDVFSLGIVLHELLTGERLFIGSSDFSTLEKVRNADIVPPSVLNENVPPELEQIVLKALAQDVDDRYQTAMDLHDELQSFMYTSGSFFARKDLSTFMHQAFAEDIANEKAREEEYRAMESQMVADVSQQRAVASGGVPGATGSAARSPKRTILGVGAVPPPPPPTGRVSHVGPPPPPPPAISPPPAPRPSLVNAPPPAAPLPPPSIDVEPDMEWDDEELSTQVYDRVPEELLVAARDDVRPDRSNQEAERMSSPSSTYDDFFPPPAEPTEVISRPKRPSKLGPIIAAAAVVLLGVGVAGWVLFAPKTPGQIELVTEPPDPTVMIDARPVQATGSPFLIRNVEAGRIHLIEVSKSGYRPWSMQVQVDPGERLELPAITLVPDDVAARPGVATRKGTGFTLDTEPSGAKVYVDGTLLADRTPVEVLDLAPGTHSIRVEHGRRYAAWQTQIEVTEGRVLALSKAVLAIQQLSVRFESDPSGAEVMLLRGSERRNVGRTPTTTEVDITGGSWTVSISKDGYTSYNETLAVPEGQEEAEVRVQLERRSGSSSPSVATNSRRSESTTSTPRPTTTQASSSTGGNGTLRINSKPWSQVYIEGKLIGNTPQMNITLPAGRHKIMLVNPEFNLRKNLTVEVKGGETVTQVVTLE